MLATFLQNVNAQNCNIETFEFSIKPGINNPCPNANPGYTVTYFRNRTIGIQGKGINAIIEEPYEKVKIIKEKKMVISYGDRLMSMHCEPFHSSLFIKAYDFKGNLLWDKGELDFQDVALMHVLYSGEILIWNVVLRGVKGTWIVKYTTEMKILWVNKYANDSMAHPAVLRVTQDEEYYRLSDSYYLSKNGTKPTEEEKANIEYDPSFSPLAFKHKDLLYSVKAFLANGDDMKPDFANKIVVSSSDKKVCKEFQVGQIYSYKENNRPIRLYKLNNKEAVLETINETCHIKLP